MTATEYIILVDEADREIGTAEKLAAHEQNLLHRAFSVFIFRRGEQFELLLQQRALHKYHSPGLWTNTCCSHPRQGENVVQAGERRLKEELGIDTRLIPTTSFRYNAHFPNGLSEHEIDHVLIGAISGATIIERNPEEAKAIRWVPLPSLEKELAANPLQFTPWFKEAFGIAKEHLGNLSTASS